MQHKSDSPVVRGFLNCQKKQKVKTDIELIPLIPIIKNKNRLDINEFIRYSNIETISNIKKKGEERR